MLCVPGRVPRSALAQGRREKSQGQRNESVRPECSQDPKNPSGSIPRPAQLHQGDSSARHPRERKAQGGTLPSYLGSHRAGRRAESQACRVGWRDVRAEAGLGGGL